MASAPPLPPPPPPPPPPPLSTLPAAVAEPDGSRKGILEVKLKPTATRVRRRDGSVFIEEKDDSGAMRQEFIGHEEKPQYVREQESGVSSLQPKMFDHANGTWKRVSRDLIENERKPCAAEGMHSENQGKHAQVPGPLKVVTYNVWFDPRNQAARADAIFRILEQSHATVIALQEVTNAFLMRLRDQPWVRERYVLSDTTGTTLRGSFAYGVCMLVSKTHVQLHTLSLHIHALPTQMNRSLLVANFSYGSSVWAVGTVHLESLDNAELRQQQLRVAFGALVRSVGDAAQRQARCNADVKTGFTPEQSSGAGAIGAGAGAGAGAGEGSGEGGLGGGSDEGGGGVKGRAQMGGAVLLGDFNFDADDASRVEHVAPFPPLVDVPN